RRAPIGYFLEVLGVRKSRNNAHSCLTGQAFRLGNDQAELPRGRLGDHQLAVLNHSLKRRRRSRRLCARGSWRRGGAWGCWGRRQRAFGLQVTQDTSVIIEGTKLKLLGLAWFQRDLCRDDLQMGYSSLRIYGPFLRPRRHGAGRRGVVLLAKAIRIIARG